MFSNILHDIYYDYVAGLPMLVKHRIEPDRVWHRILIYEAGVQF